jgi:hypothetical protein
MFGYAHNWKRTTQPLAAAALLVLISLPAAHTNAAPVRTGSLLPHRAAIHLPESGNCPALPGGTGALPDGDFSQAIDPGDNNLTVSKGTAFAPDWIVAQGNVDFNGSTYWDIGGYCSIDLDGLNVVGAIATNPFQTFRGRTYTVSFLLSGNGGAPPTVKTMTLIANKHFTQFTWDTSNNNDVEHGARQWESWSFRSGGGPVDLEFLSTDPPGSGRGMVVAAISVVRTR